MAELTFRDFAGAVMTGDDARAATVLQELLGLAPDAAASATSHFRAQMANPAFMPKAMSLRTAVQSGSDAEISQLLADCFGVSGDASTAAVAVLRVRYPKT